MKTNKTKQNHQNPINTFYYLVTFVRNEQAGKARKSSNLKTSAVENITLFTDAGADRIDRRPPPARKVRIQKHCVGTWNIAYSETLRILGHWHVFFCFILGYMGGGVFVNAHAHISPSPKSNQKWPYYICPMVNEDVSKQTPDALRGVFPKRVYFYREAVCNYIPPFLA